LSFAKSRLPIGRCNGRENRAVLTILSPGAVGIREISLQIKPGQKVGICGRTGRLVEATNDLAIVADKGTAARVHSWLLS